MTYNLRSPNGLLEPCVLTDLAAWYHRETIQVAAKPIRTLLRHVGRHLHEFIHWPERAVLLWSGCNRVAAKGSRQRIHKYPEKIRLLARNGRLPLDNRPNGPAIAAFVLAGGERPARFGSSNSWSIHHVYSGKFPYFGQALSMHAAKQCDHFTQSAGLVATHPIADSLSDEFPFFSWLLRAESFNRFGYDPDGVFSSRQNKYGFASEWSCKVLVRELVAF